MIEDALKLSLRVLGFGATAWMAWYARGDLAVIRRAAPDDQFKVLIATERYRTELMMLVVQGLLLYTGVETFGTGVTMRGSVISLLLTTKSLYRHAVRKQLYRMDAERMDR